MILLHYCNSLLAVHTEKELDDLNSKVIECSLCPRLSQYIKNVGRIRVKRHIDEKYWAAPLPSFGDPNAKMLIVGLAPAAHGGNRTGRMFTGDSSGNWLAKAMHETGFANISTSQSKNDGLVLIDAYITAAVRCAPPGNKPTTLEISNCSQYLAAELKILKDARVVLALGKIGFDAYCKNTGLKGLKFGHGLKYQAGGKTLIASYHPSRQNTNTRKLTWEMWIQVFKTARKIIDKK